MDKFSFTEVHRHFGGSISPYTVSKVSGIPLELVRKQMVFGVGDRCDYSSFFRKFHVLDNIEWDYVRISLTIQDVVWGLKREGIKYAEIKFSINKYLKFIKTSINEFVLWFVNEFDIYSSYVGVTVDLILSLKHDMDRKSQVDIGNLVKNDLIAECIAGIDIVGDERKFDVDFYKPIFDLWHSAGRVCMAHVGEIDKPQHVIDAINILKVDRVCHGIAVAGDKEIAKISRDRLISFDVCISSNFCTGVAKRGKHPVKEMLRNGFIINIGTDDPTTFNSNICNEFRLLKSESGLSDGDIALIRDNTINFSAQEIIKRKLR
jgi:adenosine deaminase